jgi:acetylornithine deacetylase/succinyl-diaminopimelate desuccinylase-like protein
VERALRYAEEHAEDFERSLVEFLRVPSISADPAYAGDVARCAEWLAHRMQAAGLDAEVVRSAGEHPLVHARSPHVAGAPTVMVYGHFDVQPVDPLELWETPPFEPTVTDGVLRARGAADDKGPTLAMVAAAEAWALGAGGLPTNLVFLVEGEEECGGQHLPRYVRENREALRADALVVLDVAGFAPGVPALCYGLRGILTADVRVDGPSRDLHSGAYGGAVANPAEVLARLLASCRHADGSLVVAGLHDDVAPLSEEERQRLAALPADEEAFAREAGVAALFGEPGRGLHERLWARPTLEVNGIFGGYQGEGAKTIIPAWAGAKLSLRLVPGQDPGRVFACLEQHLARHCPPTVRLTVTRGHSAPALYVPPEGPWAERALRALSDAFGAEPRLVRSGGSIPVATTFHEVLGLAPLVLGTYSPGENAHAPNERYPLSDFHAAVRTGVRFFGLSAPCL